MPAGIEKVENLTNITQKLFTWFPSNQMKANPGKCHLLLSTQEEANIQITNITIESSRSQKLLEIVIDNKLKFELHIGNICQRVNRKLNEQERLTKYKELLKRRISMSAFFKAQFNYCPIVWMFHFRSLNNKINRLKDYLKR